MLFESKVRRALEVGDVNHRQYSIISFILEKSRPISLDEIRKSAWYQSLYLKLNDKTRRRDLKQLQERDLIKMDKEGRILPGF